MDQPGTPPPLKKRRFFNDPTPHVKKIAQSPTPEENIDGAAQALEVTGLSSDPEIPVAEGPTNESSAEEDGFDTTLFTSIIGEELPATAITKLRQVSGGNMERGTLHHLNAPLNLIFHYSNTYSSGDSSYQYVSQSGYPTTSCHQSITN